MGIIIGGLELVLVVDGMNHVPIVFNSSKYLKETQII
jgi:hypothetical protein